VSLEMQIYKVAEILARTSARVPSLFTIPA
jgi:hypothetical protein